MEEPMMEEERDSSIIKKNGSHVYKVVPSFERENVAKMKNNKKPKVTIIMMTIVILGLIIGNAVLLGKNYFADTNEKNDELENIKSIMKHQMDIIRSSEDSNIMDMRGRRNINHHPGNDSLWASVSSVTSDQCDECQCKEEVCDMVFDETCNDDGVCKDELKKCMDKCIDKDEIINEEQMQLENELAIESLVEKIVEEQISLLPRSHTRRIKKSAASRLDFDLREQELSNVIVDCVKEKGIEMEFVSKNTSNLCTTWFNKDSLDIFFARCQAEWISGYNRAEFYEKCLKKTNIKSFHWQLRQQSKLLEQIAFNVERYSKDFSDARVAGGSQLIAGGLLCGLGVVIPPLAPIASFLGIGLTMTGTATSMASTLLGSDWTDQEALNARAEIIAMDADYHNLANVIGLYLKSIHYLSEKTKKGTIGVGITALSSLEEKISTSLIQASPAIARLPQIGKIIFKKISKSSLVKGLGAKKFATPPNAFNFLTKISDKVPSVANSKFGMALNKMVKSTTFKKIGKLAVPGLTMAIGVWDVVCGADKANVHKGLLSEIRGARRELEYNGDSVKNAFIQMFPDYTNFTDGGLASVSLLEFHVKSGAWDIQNGIKLRMQSTNSNNVTKDCYTEDFFHGIQGSNTWINVFDNKDLGQCGTDFLIYNDTVSVQLISQHDNAVFNDVVIVDKINIGTNGHFLPSLTCKGKDLTVNAGNQSEWMNCERRQGINRIKVHTSNEHLSGTDNYIYFGFDITTSTGGVVSCKTGDLNNEGNDRERGDTDIYRPADGSFGDCRDSELANAILDRDLKMPNSILLTIISTQYGIDDQWHPDSIKVYFNTKESKTVVITCALCGRKEGNCGAGWGAWVAAGNITFECFPLAPEFPERSIEKLQVRTCDLKHAGSSSDTLRMKICSKQGMMRNSTIYEYHEDYINGKSPCCTTNLFGGGNTFTRGQWSNDIDGNGITNGIAHDGGEQLGQCEGFPIDGTELYIGLKNDYHGAACLDAFKFYGGYDVGVSSSRDIPIIQCDTRSTCQLWSDSNYFPGLFGQGTKNYCEGDRTSYDWKDKEVKCQFVNNTSTVKTIAMKVCDKASSGSKAKFQFFIRNLDDEECATEEFKSDLRPGDYFEYSDMGECLTHPIKDNKATVWILNNDSRDDLCLSDVYLDVSDASSGETSMLKCRVDQDKPMKLNVSGKDRIGLPLTCV